MIALALRLTSLAWVWKRMIRMRTTVVQWPLRLSCVPLFLLSDYILAPDPQMSILSVQNILTPSAFIYEFDLVFILTVNSAYFFIFPMFVDLLVDLVFFTPRSTIP